MLALRVVVGELNLVVGFLPDGEENHHVYHGGDGPGDGVGDIQGVASVTT